MYILYYNTVTLPEALFKYEFGRHYSLYVHNQFS